MIDLEDYSRSLEYNTVQYENLYNTHM